MYKVGRCGAQMLSVFQSGPGRRVWMDTYDFNAGGNSDLQWTTEASIQGGEEIPPLSWINSNWCKWRFLGYVLVQHGELVYLSIFTLYSALVWGSSVKFSPQKVGKEHVLQDEDVVQVVKK